MVQLQLTQAVTGKIIRPTQRKIRQKRLGALNAATMRRVDEAIKISLGLVAL